MNNFGLSRGIALLLVVCSYISNAQTTIIQNIDTIGIRSGDNLTDLIPDVRFTGVGSLITRSAGQGFDESANISGEFNMGTNKNWMLNLGFNLGNKFDSSYVDSVALKDIFYPDRSRLGFSGLLAWDVLRSVNPMKVNGKTWWDIPGKAHSLSNINAKSSSKYKYWQLWPTLEMSYQRRNFITIDSLPTNRLETFTVIGGLRSWYKMHIRDNQFGFTCYGYWKQQTVSTATLDTYRLIFNDENGGNTLSPQATFIGASVGLLINDALISFTYENLLTEDINNRDVKGGVFLIKLSLGARFLEFN